jgi:hypothetical protein
MLFERAGIPAAAIITDVFETTAREMTKLWGVPDYRFAQMAHPLASLTDAQLDAQADALVDKVARLVMGGKETG